MMNIDFPEASSRWIVVESRKDRRPPPEVKLLAQCRSMSGSTEITITVPRDGPIHEVIRLPNCASRVEWNRNGADNSLVIRPIGAAEALFHLFFRIAVTYFAIPKQLRRDCGLTLARAIFDLPGAYRIAISLIGETQMGAYRQWAERFIRLSHQDEKKIQEDIQRFCDRQRFHLLISSSGSDEIEAVRSTLISLRDQLYRQFNCVLISSSSQSSLEICELLSEVGESSCLVTRETLAQWLSSFNECLRGERAQEWVMVLRAGDIVPKHALYWFAHDILKHPGAHAAYSDDDTVGAGGRSANPRFKCDWSPLHLRSTNYAGGAAVIKGAPIAAAGGLTSEHLRHGIYDLLFRVSEETSAQPIHIPAVLLHRQDRQGQGSTHEVQDSSCEVQGSSHKVQGAEEKQGALVDGWEDPQWCMEKLREHLARTGVRATVEPTLPGCWRVRYQLPDSPPLVSIIIPTRNQGGLLRQCIESIGERTSYSRFEIIVMDNQSDHPGVLAYMQDLKQDQRIRVLRYDRPFNYSAINNAAARQARGEVLLLLNNDTQVISPDWLEEMLGHLIQPGVGAVGAKLYYPNDTVQHAGDTVGPGGCADHLHQRIERGDPGYCNRAVVAQEVSAVTGACLMTWKHLYDKLGGLNERDLPVAFNDADYCLRLQEAGYRVIFTPHAELYHYESASRGKDVTWPARWRAGREIRYMQRRWAERMKHDPYYNPNLSYMRPDFSLSEYPRVKKPWTK